MARLYTSREVRTRRTTLKVFAGMFDYIATIVSVVIIIGCAILLSEMIKWIASDFDTSFGAMLNMFEEAVVID